jgi:peptidoglycan/LPS O-acetylase OafA/YrhL
MGTLNLTAAPFRVGVATSPVDSMTGSRQPASHEHTFANNVRFLSMAAIIGAHTVGIYCGVVQLPSIPLSLVFIEQSLKFGTIAFFLVAGFLFGERIDAYSPLGYFKRRLRNVFVPWLFWFSLFCMLMVGADVVHARLIVPIMPHVLIRCTECLVGTAFWFVPNLLFALALLLLFRRLLHDARMGFVFLLASLFYGVNIYGEWIPVAHTQAIFGFVFYLWLGAWCAWHFPALEKRLARLSASVMLGLILLALVLALAESKLLYALGSIDPLNTLRISNQLYSVVVVLGILKVKRALWPRFVDVRKHTFGLYLTHTAGIALLGAAFRRLLPYFAPLSRWRESTEGLLLILVMFCLTYAGCLLAVRALLSNPSLRWVVGLPAQSAARIEHTVERKFGEACEAGQPQIP